MKIGMKRYLKASIVVSILAAMLASGSVWARGGHGHHHFHRHARVGVFIGVPLAAPWFYSPPPSYYYYPPVVIPSSPPVYIEQSAPPAAPAAQSNYWYYCDNPAGYYPYVKQCPQGWQRVVPQPPPS